MRAGIAAGLTAVVLAGCMTQQQQEFDRPTPLAGSGDTLARSLNDAGFDIFRAAGDAANLAVSPVSIGLAFGMVDAGATGRVDAALGELFQYPSEGTELLEAFNALDQSLASEAGEGAANADGETVDLPIVRIANRAFIDEAFAPNPEYTSAIRRYFGAEAQRAPLRKDRAGSRALIDGWVSDRTEGLIPKILPEDQPGDDTVMMLVNTVYMKAQWFDPFDANLTHERDFHLVTGDVASVDLMTDTFTCGFATSDKYDAAVLPYVGNLEMVLVVPREGQFDSVQSAISQEFLDGLDAATAEGRVVVAMPKFETEAKVDLRDVIENGLGVGGLFGEVGLDGIGPDLGVDSAVHATKVIVDEAGTEAAAATVIGVVAMSAPINDAEVIADRPFLYVIRDTRTGAVLFVGRYTDPAAG